MVVLEGLRAAVVLVAVRFDDQVLGPPEKVDLTAPGPYVDLRLRQSMALAEPQEEVLQLAPGRLARRQPGPQPQHLRLANRPAVLRRRDSPFEIREGLRRRGHGNATTARTRTRRE